MGVCIGFVRSSKLKYAVRGGEGDIFPDFWMCVLRGRADVTAMIALRAGAYRRTFLRL